MNSIQPKCDGDNDEMDFKCVLHRTLLYHFVSLFRVESQRSSRHVIPADYRSLLSDAATRNFHFTSHHASNDVAAALTSWMQTCPSYPRWHTGGSCHHQHVALSCLATTWRSKVAADWHLITATHSGFTIGCLRNLKLSISSCPAIVSLFVRLYCSDSFC